MMVKQDTFNRAVSSFRTVLTRKARMNGTISSIDINDVAENIRGSERGAAVRAAFRQLVDEKVIRPTRKMTYNPETGHRVMTYSRR